MKNVPSFKYFLIGAGSAVAIVFAVPALGHVDVSSPTGVSGNTGSQVQVQPGQGGQGGFNQGGQGGQGGFNQGGQGGQGGFNQGGQGGPGGYNQGGQGGPGGFNQGGQGGPGGYNQGGQGGQGFDNGGMGDGQNIDPKELERQKKQFLNDRGYTQDLKRIQSSLKKLPTGWTVPQDITEAMAKVDAIKAEVQAATDIDTINNARDELNSAMDTVRQSSNSLMRVNDYVRMEKQITGEIKKLTKKLAQAEASFAKSGIDGGALVAKASAALDAAQALASKASQDARSFSEDADSEFQEFFESLGDVWQLVGSLQAVKDISKGTKFVEKNIASVKKKIQSLARKNSGVDTDGALALVDEAANVMSELKAYVKSPDFDPEEIMTYFGSLNDLRDQIDGALEGQLDVNFFPMEMAKGLGGPMGGPGKGGPMGGPGQGGSRDGGDFGGGGPQGGF